MKGRKEERRMDEKPKENLGVALLHVPQHVGVEMGLSGVILSYCPMRDFGQASKQKGTRKKKFFLGMLHSDETLDLTV